MCLQAFAYSTFFTAVSVRTRGLVGEENTCFETAAMLITFMLLGKFLETVWDPASPDPSPSRPFAPHPSASTDSHHPPPLRSTPQAAKGRASEAVSQLLTLQPATAHRVVGDEKGMGPHEATVEVPQSSLLPGQVVKARCPAASEPSQLGLAPAPAPAPTPAPTPTLILARTLARTHPNPHPNPDESGRRR